MNQRLTSFASRAIKRPLMIAPSRKLYTDPIYPYPHKYFSEYKYPSVQCYRENIKTPGDWEKHETVAKWSWRLFWAYIFWSFFHDPGAVFGHHVFPNPELWTDEELGIPPLEAGPYKEWAASKIVEE